ncbi:MAG: energy-coupled thiamine transporter ThiT [Clostridia bacterium]|nr:energy-coupled thiamine transporter ThiT [Clostridia bacterium]
MKRKRIITLCECSVLLAMSAALSFVIIYPAPMGGSVTLLSMLPLLLIGYKHGIRWGLVSAFLYSLIQLCQAIGAGNVFIYCYTPAAVVICVLFDYILPFTALGLTSLGRLIKKNDSTLPFLIMCALLIIFRFLCHYITGVVIWDQLAPDGMGKYLYSLLYNGGYMLPELVLTLAAAAVITGAPQFKKMLR